jgi:hypothetical protein
VSSSPIAQAAGHLNALARRDPEPAGAAPAGLLEALVPDPRDPRGVRYDLVPVLAVAVCATLADTRSFAEWAGDAGPELRAGLGLPGAVPDLVTIWRVLTAVDPAALDRGARLVGHGPARGPPGAGLAVEGKTLRGARTSQGPAPHLLACLDHGSGVVCPQIAVDGKTNGITMLADLPGQITDLNGAVRTAGALHAQHEHAIYLHNRGSHYIFTAKATSPACTASSGPCPGKTSPPATASQDCPRPDREAHRQIGTFRSCLWPTATKAQNRKYGAPLKAPRSISRMLDNRLYTRI